MTAEDDPFESPRLLLAGAAKHLKALRERYDDLRLSEWAAPAPDPDGTVLVAKDFAVPSEMKQIIFDATNNLRSALDHAVFASVYALTGEEADQTKFPFGDTAEEVLGDVKRRCRNVPRDMVEFLIAFEPHRLGNHLLWGLNKLRNTKTHRVLVPVSAVSAQTGTGSLTGVVTGYFFDHASGQFKQRVELPPGFERGAEIKFFRLELLIGTGTFRGEPALSILDRLLGEVERVVSAIEAETARLLRERAA